MYSVVLMMALSGSADLPAFGHRCHGCAGACHGGGWGCHGCRGGGRCHGGCNGGACHGGYDCHGGCHGGMEYGPEYAPEYRPAPGTAPGKAPEPVKPPKATGDKKTELPAPASIIVSLPADARLTVDDVVTKSTSATRLFATPALESGKEFHYTLKAEVVRDGKTYTAIRRVAVRAGEETRVTLDIPATTLALR